MAYRNVYAQIWISEVETRKEGLPGEMGKERGGKRGGNMGEEMCEEVCEEIPVKKQTQPRVGMSNTRYHTRI
jgi:hypothetical protein